MKAPAGQREATAITLALLLAGAGVTHFARPRPYDSIVPRWLPGSARAWTYASGAAELAVSAAIACPRTRRSGGLAAAVLFAAVFPANVQMAIDWRHRPVPLRALAVGRLPLQAPLIWWALRARGYGGGAPGRCRGSGRREMGTLIGPGRPRAIHRAR